MRLILKPRSFLKFIFITGALLVLAASTGCGARPRRTYPMPEGNIPFRPPTLAPTTIPTHALTSQPSALATPTALACTNVLKFINDISIPDGTEVKPGSTLDKRWEIENSGSCNWDDRYRLRQIGGPPMGSPKDQALFPARSGSHAVIRLLLAAPAEEKQHRSAWQAVGPDDQPFGVPIFIDIVVKQDGALLTPSPAPTTQ